MPKSNNNARSNALFAGSDSQQPLAERLRPHTQAGIIGQAHLLAAGAPLAQLLAGQGALHSMILWGPPGCGKTTIARALSAVCAAHWFSLSAVTSGIKEVRQVIEQAQQLRSEGDGAGRILFVDEVHHFNKSQQDAFLPHVESGLFVFVGATTENPSFEINNALLSRVAVYHLQPLDDEALARILHTASESLNIKLTDDAQRAVIGMADGDARRLLNALERAAALAGKDGKSAGAVLDTAAIEQSNPSNYRQFDKRGDWFYDHISALHKAVRGSDPDAALYWLCRMLDGEVDPRYIGRRLIRIASEDVGLADYHALALALQADQAYRQLGHPEGELALAHATIYLACVPKSNSVYRAFGKMQAFVQKDKTRAIPNHMRNAPTKLMKDEGAGRDYQNPHAAPDAILPDIPDNYYFPDGMDALRYYQPKNQGLEQRIKQHLEKIRHRRGGD